MHNNVKLSASLMCVDWMNAGAQIKELEECGKVDFLHYDIVDGNFAPDFTLGSSIINKFLNSTKLFPDYHLMVEEPARLLNAFPITPGQYYTIHQECCRNLHRDLVRLRQMGAKPGVALSPGTPIEALEYIIEDIDMVLLMTVDPGYMGQPLIPQTLRKAEKLKKLIKDMNLNVAISMDGNVNASTVPDMVAAGADILVLGSSGLFRKDMPIKEAVANICDAIDKGRN